MRTYGFSTGAISLGDFKRALSLLEGHNAKAVELSALRDHELPGLVNALPSLHLERYEYVSIHAPSEFIGMAEAAAADLLSACIPLGIPIVMHPDAIRDIACWKQFGTLLCIENMDKRKKAGRTADELQVWFDRFPEAGFCLDLGHARQVDPSIVLAFELVDRFGKRLTQIHLSEINAQCKHEPLSMGAVVAFKAIGEVLGSVPVIVESRVSPSQIGAELEMARRALGA